MPKYSPPSLWFVPLRRDWDEYASPNYIPIIQRSNNKVVLLAAGRTNQGLAQARQVCADHNAPIHLAHKKRKTLTYEPHQAS